MQWALTASEIYKRGWSDYTSITDTDTVNMIKLA